MYYMNRIKVKACNQLDTIQCAYPISSFSQDNLVSTFDIECLSCKHILMSYWNGKLCSQFSSVHIEFWNYQAITNHYVILIQGPWANARRQRLLTQRYAGIFWYIINRFIIFYFWFRKTKTKYFQRYPVHCAGYKTFTNVIYIIHSTCNKSNIQRSRYM